MRSGTLESIVEDSLPADKGGSAWLDHWWAKVPEQDEDEADTMLTGSVPDNEQSTLSGSFLNKFKSSSAPLISSQDPVFSEREGM